MKTMIAAAALLALAAPTAAQPSDGIAGRWRTDDGKAIITIGPCAAPGGALCGRITRFLVPEPTGGARDGNNPDRALRARPLLGVQVLSGLRAGTDARWTGRGYSPEEGRNFNATVRATGNRLTVRGCVAVFCRTVVWTRAG